MIKTDLFGQERIKINFFVLNLGVNMQELVRFYADYRIK